MFTELADLEAASLTSYEILRAATANAGAWIAEHIRPPRPPGVLAAGHAADLLLLDADPLADWRALATRLRAVVARGRWIDPQDLEARLESQAATYEAQLEPYRGRHGRRRGHPASRGK
jgi:hypothetical protein